MLLLLACQTIGCDAVLLQTEDFYNFADENGLLIWQDAMFGGSHYPRTAEWLNNYAEEISQQVRQAVPMLRVCVCEQTG